MADISALDRELNQLITSGKAMDAFEKFYAEDCTMQENKHPPRVGKAANREFEIQFFSAVEAVHEVRLVSESVSGDRSFSEWIFDLTFKDGTRKRGEQVAVRVWTPEGKVKSERFYYDPS